MRLKLNVELLVDLFVCHTLSNTSRTCGRLGFGAEYEMWHFKTTCVWLYVGRFVCLGNSRRANGPSQSLRSLYQDMMVALTSKVAIYRLSLLLWAHRLGLLIIGLYRIPCLSRLYIKLLVGLLCQN